MTVFVGDLIHISMNSGIDLSDKTLTINYFSPEGIIGSWSATVDSTNHNLAKYITNSSDLSTEGVWKLQLFASSPTFRGHSRIVEMVVSRNI